MPPTVSQLLRDHVSLSITSIDRLYINAYVPQLQTTGQLIHFMQHHLRKPIPSLALMGKLRTHFIDEVKSLAARDCIPLVRFRPGERKDRRASWYRARYRATHGIVFIGVARERAASFKTTKGNHISRQPVAVNHYYFYLHDREWGPCFLKVCGYAPFPGKLCLNGHEWAKQQLRHEGIPFESLDNGFLSCEDPQRLAELTQRLGPQDIQDVFNRWVPVLPWPLDADARAAGYRHALSVRQMEVSLTQVFDRPLQGRRFFEQVIRDNLDLGRPDRVSLLFPTRLTRRTPKPKHGYRTRVITAGVLPSLHVEYKRSHVKQYHKENRALRTETTINNPADFGLNKGIHKNLHALKAAAAAVNEKLLEVERVSEDCVLSVDELNALQSPTVHDGQRAPALRFGDRRVMALLHALCLFLLLPAGFRNRDLRPRVADLLGLTLETYTRGRMTYDLRRLRLKGLIRRIDGTHIYEVTPVGLRVAYFYTKVHLRILEPGWASISNPPGRLPRRLRSAFRRVDTEIKRLCDRAALREAA